MKQSALGPLARILRTLGCHALALALLPFCSSNLKKQMFSETSADHDGHFNRIFNARHHTGMEESTVYDMFDVG
jgi:hypothetical protein